MKKFFILIISFFLNLSAFSQVWTLELKSYVEYRTWSLTTKAVSKEIQLQGATIKLFDGAKLVSQVTSDADGEFTLTVPANGEFIGEVSYPGCNAKRFTVSTLGVPEKVGDNDYKPTFTVRGGFVMVKPYPAIDYSNLEKSLIKVSYRSGLKNFDDEIDATNVGLGLVGEVYDAENILFEKFCAKNREGDAALKIPDCPLARKLYNEAIAIIPNEEYPVEQLKKVGACLKEIEEAERKAKEAAEAKEKERLAQLEKDKLKASENSKKNEEKEKASKEKSEADKLAKENAYKEKAKKKEVETIVKSRGEARDGESASPKKTDDDEIAKKKKKADDDELAKKKRKADDEEAARKRKGDSETDWNKGKRTGNPDEIVGGKKPSTPPDDEMDLTGTKHHPIRKMVGTDQYKADMVKANDLFKHKRYEEAKPVYEQALLAKPEDATAKAKLEEIEKLLKK
jgi:tetratricopeptide (TPR) repeat protein